MLSINETAGSMLIHTRDFLGATNMQIADQFGVNESTARWYMDLLLRDRLIRFEKEGRYKKYYLEGDVAQIVQRLSKYDFF